MPARSGRVPLASGYVPTTTSPEPLRLGKGSASAADVAASLAACGASAALVDRVARFGADVPDDLLAEAVPADWRAGGSSTPAASRRCIGRPRPLDKAAPTSRPCRKHWGSDGAPSSSGRDSDGGASPPTGPSGAADARRRRRRAASAASARARGATDDGDAGDAEGSDDGAVDPAEDDRRVYDTWFRRNRRPPNPLADDVKADIRALLDGDREWRAAVATAPRGSAAAAARLARPTRAPAAGPAARRAARGDEEREEGERRKRAAAAAQRRAAAADGGDGHGGRAPSSVLRIADPPGPAELHAWRMRREAEAAFRLARWRGEVRAERARGREVSSALHGSASDRLAAWAAGRRRALGGWDRLSLDPGGEGGGAGGAPGPRGPAGAAARRGRGAPGTVGAGGTGRGGRPVSPPLPPPQPLRPAAGAAARE